MQQLKMSWTDTMDIAVRMVNALDSVKLPEGSTKKDYREAKTIFVKSVLDELRHQMFYHPPSRN